MKYRLIDKKWVIVRYNMANTGIVVLSYSAMNLESYGGKKPEWRDVYITRDEFRSLLMNSPYADNMIPSMVLRDWVQNNTIPDFLRTGDWFIYTLLEDPVTSMWCLNGKLQINNPILSGHVDMGQKFEFVLAYDS